MSHSNVWLTVFPIQFDENKDFNCFSSLETSWWYPWIPFKTLLKNSRCHFNLITYCESTSFYLFFPHNLFTWIAIKSYLNKECHVRTGTLRLIDSKCQLSILIIIQLFVLCLKDQLSGMRNVLDTSDYDDIYILFNAITHVPTLKKLFPDFFGLQLRTGFIDNLQAVDLIMSKKCSEK